ncbi:hypothetical protein VTJ04DRAFT_196 [Mycothermus thermophilus]
MAKDTSGRVGEWERELLSDDEHWDVSHEFKHALNKASYTTGEEPQPRH